MRLETSSIFVGVKRLRNLLYEAQFGMQKADRIIYGTPLMESCGKVLQNFIIAFQVPMKREAYIDEAIGWFVVLRTDIEFCAQKNILHFGGKKNDDGVPTRKMELFTLIAQIDNDMCKYRASIAQGKSVSA